ncbi:MAG: SDR family oxidoreductase [Bacteroidetes bacterium]|nr:SDR family oxidoreductase [Bacteroidota bacterium]MBU1719947.1 SDR family oxidoreductase [Bacteroidota bacterium]
MKIFLTGATGFIGSRVLCDLLQSGHQIRALVRSGAKRGNISEAFQLAGVAEEGLIDQVEWFDGDLSCIHALEDALTDMEVVIHCAGAVSFNRKDKHKLWETNVEGTKNLVDAAVSTTIKHFIHVSSIASLGRAEKGADISEDTHWESAKRNSFYSITKYHGEMEVWRGMEEGLPAVIVNPGVVLGCGDWNAGSNSLFKYCRNGNRFFTSGINGFVDVRDVSSAILILMEQQVCSERFILVSESMSYKDLFTMICCEFGEREPKTYIAEWVVAAGVPVSAVFSRITGKMRLITNETIRTAYGVFNYSNLKISEKTGFKFRPLKDTISDSCSYYKKKYDN